VEAAAWTIYEPRQGEMLASNNATARRPVASLMKLLTAQVAFDAGQPTKLVTAPNDGLVLSDDESVIDIRGGQELSRDLLVRAMLKASANDAARLLALDIAGSEAAFAELMNATAANLQLNDTHAVNATGLDADGQFSTAYDMTMLGARLMGSSINFQVAVRDPTAELNGQAYPNPNDLLGLYPGADGIKTGRTSGAGWCIVASAIRDGRRLVVTVLGAPTREARNNAAMALLDWGFAQPA
jgi:D-alanyl-D-alanine carboxypeptidase (penicillin-binding protein 5/6)